MGHNHVVSGNPKSTGISQVDELSTGPPDLGCHNPTEEAVESVNPGVQRLPASDPSGSIRSESQVPTEPNEALLRISQDMTLVLERLTAPKAPMTW